MELARLHPARVEERKATRPLLAEIGLGRERLEEALDRERRGLMRTNENRLEAYRRASARWAGAWQELERETAGLPLEAVHARLVAKAQDLLPVRVDDPR